MAKKKNAAPKLVKQKKYADLIPVPEIIPGTVLLLRLF